MATNDPPDPPGRMRRATFVSLMDEQLFAAWQTGGPAARLEAWTRLWTGVFSFAVAFCSHFAPDAHASEACASDAVNQACLDVQRRLDAGLRWEGEPQFTGFFVNYVKRRCLDGCREMSRVAARTDDSRAADSATGRPIEAIASVPSGMPAVRRTQKAIEHLVDRLEWSRTVCLGRDALVAVIDGKLAYLQACCLRAVEGAAASALSPVELVPFLDRDAVDASSEEMSEFIMERLQISRNVLDLRQREIRKLVKQAGAGEDGGAPGSGTFQGSP